MLDSKINFIKFHKIAILLSSILIISSISLIFTKGLNLGIDFSGGILIEARTKQNIQIADLRQFLSKNHIKKFNIQSFNKNEIMIRISKDESQDQSKIVKKIQNILINKFPEIEYRKIDYVGPRIGTELIKSGIISLILSSLFVMIYIWSRFNLSFGIGSIIALIHDAIITIGFISITGLEFNITSIAALLTIIGYSINDSVVIYDRIRENLRKFKKMKIDDLINLSINQTLKRTIITSGTTLIALLSLILFGGDILLTFSMSVFFGILIGTYSSIYIASPILIYNNGK